jgi:hypothetical protein
MSWTTRLVHRGASKVLASLGAMTLLGATALSASAAEPDLIDRVILSALMGQGATAGVILTSRPEPGTTYEYVWSDERGERARTATTSTIANLPIELADYGRSFRVSVTVREPSGLMSSMTSPVDVAERWHPALGIVYDETTKIFAPQMPHLPATFTADLGTVSVDYRWSRSGVPIAGDPGEPWAHRRTSQDQGETLTLEMTTEQPATGVTNVQDFGRTPPIGVMRLELTPSGDATSGDTVSLARSVVSHYPGPQDVALDVSCAFQWYRNGAPLFAETHSYHYVHTLERGTTLRARAVCSASGYLTTTVWSPDLRVPGTPAIVSRWGNDALRDLARYSPWFDRYMYAPGRVGSFDLNAYYEPTVSPTRSMTAVALAGDLDDDGREDTIARDAAGALWSYGRYRSTRIGASGWNAMNLVVAGGDFTGDRAADLFARRSTGELVFYAGRGRQGLAPGKVVATTAFRSARQVLTIGDSNGDGLADLHVTWSNGDMSFYAGRGNGGLAAPIKVGSGWSSMTRLLLARDLNRDGRADLLALDANGRLWLYPGNGKGGYTTRSLTNSGSPLTSRIY